MVGPRRERLSSGDLIPKAMAPSTSACRWARATRPSGSTTPSGWRAATRTIRSAKFYFGGFGNNYVDDGEVKRYREFGSFPGFEIDEVGGQPLRQVAGGAQPAARAVLQHRPSEPLPELGALGRVRRA